MQSHSPQAALEASALPPLARLVTSALVAAAGAGVPLVMQAVVLPRDYPLSLSQVWFATAVVVIAPAAAAWMLGRGCSASVSVEGGDLVVARSDRRFEVPLASIAALEPWKLPLPGYGVNVRLRSGEGLGIGLWMRDPGRLASLVADPALCGPLLEHPSSTWASARAGRPPRGLPYLFLKFPVYALPPASTLFYTHQWIAYGGPWGQWIMQGPEAWARTLASYWLTMVIYVLLWASVWRGAAEMSCFAVAHLAPARARLARTAAEWTCALAYWVGIPVLLALRYAG